MCFLPVGLRSYGKVVYIFSTLSLVGFVVFATKILGLFPMIEFQKWLQSQDWTTFIYNPKVGGQSCLYHEILY